MIDIDLAAWLKADSEVPGKGRGAGCILVYMAGSVISVRVDEEQKRRLDALSARTGRPGAFYLRRALDAHLGELEYIYGLEADAQAVRAGELKTISLADLEAECGLGD